MIFGNPAKSQPLPCESFARDFFPIYYAEIQGFLGKKA